MRTLTANVIIVKTLNMGHVVVMKSIIVKIVATVGVNQIGGNQMTDERMKFAAKNFTVGLYVFCNVCEMIIYTSPDMTDFSKKNEIMDKHLEDKHGIGGNKK